MTRFLLAALVPVVLGTPAPASAQHPPVGSSSVVEGIDFRVYDSRGRSKSFAEVVAAMEKVEAVLVGETHDDAVGHGVETQLLIRGAQRVGAVGGAAERPRPVVLSLEMFERDVQYVLDEYLDGLITEDQFRRSARPWDRYETDYRPMVEFARAHDLPVVATNAPRRYVNRVSRMGPASLDALSEEARAFLPPLPYPGPSKEYTAQWNVLMAEMMSSLRSGADTASGDEPAEAEAPAEVEATSPPPSHDMGNALHAQALWDAAMGEAVATSLREHPGALVIHYAGSFHVRSGTGIPERVADYRPGTRVLTVVLEPAEDIGAWDDDEHERLADFVILTRKPPPPAAGG